MSIIDDHVRDVMASLLAMRVLDVGSTEENNFGICCFSTKHVI